jgi:sigma-E factor negative regulatory protein RseA
MDGELDDKSAAAVIQALSREPEAREAWRTYQLIGDAMRESRVLSPDFSARLAVRLAAEPTVLAPRALQPHSRRWFALSAAASLAAVALVGWLAFAPQPQVAPTAKAPAAPLAAQSAAEPKPNMVPLPSGTNDYLLAHQGFSPRVSLQGVAAYVRTVSEQAVESRK